MPISNSSRINSERPYVKHVPSHSSAAMGFLSDEPDSNIWLFQVGFNPLKILKKRNKALRKVKNLLKKSNSDITEVRFYTTRLLGGLLVTTKTIVFIYFFKIHQSSANRTAYGI